MGRAVRAAAAVLLALTLTPTTGHALPPEKPIQPGARLSIDGAGCTMNFVFARGSTRYVGTAGHCGRVGERASGSTGAFGTVVFSRYTDDLDFALIEVDPGRVGEVEPSVRAWGGPTGVTDEAGTATGSVVSIYGYGVVVGSSPLTRARNGVLVRDTDTSYEADMPAVNGDSGGPIIERATGKALGIISRYGFDSVPPSTDAGPTVEHVIRSLHGAGFGVELLTAAY